MLWEDGQRDQRWLITNYIIFTIRYPLFATHTLKGPRIYPHNLKIITMYLTIFIATSYIPKPYLNLTAPKKERKKKTAKKPYTQSDANEGDSVREESR